MTNKGKRGGAGRAQGRKPLGRSETVSFSIRMTAEQREKLDGLGGSKWVRLKIDEAEDELKKAVTKEVNL